jgi:hypothetical protein
MGRSELPSLAATDIFGTPDMMQKPTGGQAIVHSLDATAYMAFGYAKTTGRVGAFSQAPAAVAEAFRQMSTGRTREVSPWGLLKPPAKRNDR